MTIVELTAGLEQCRSRHPAGTPGPVCFAVRGIPHTQGSKSGFVVNGRVVLREGSSSRAAADGRFGATVWWRPDTIAVWLASRRKRGNPAWRKGGPAPPSSRNRPRTG